MLLTPQDLKINTISEDKTNGVFTFEPLPTSFGHTLGSILRRVISTSMQGAALTQVKIAGADHQFTTLPGVKEDVVELTLNLKKIKLVSYSENPVVVTINKKGQGPVTAGDIETPSDVEILNKDQLIATLADKNSSINMELLVEKGIGYSPMEERQTNKIGVIVLDALFSPVLNVSYEVEPARFGKSLNMDKLTLSIETTGAVAPKETIVKAAKMLSDYFATISSWIMPEEATTEETPVKKVSSTESLGGADVSVDELPLPTRTINALKKQGIETLGQLANKTDEDLSDIKNLGEKSVNEIKKLLKR